MIKLFISSALKTALAALLLAALLLTDCIVFERTAFSEIRVRFFGAVIKIDLSDPAEIFGGLAQGLRLWCDTLPQTLTELFGSGAALLENAVRERFSGSYSPSCGLC